VDVALGPDCFFEVAKDHDAGFSLYGKAILVLFVEVLNIHGRNDGNV
jgi:hypothetical protein